MSRGKTMAKYHVNYEGKILPCRAKLGRCPYSSANHGDSYEELYSKAQEFSLDELPFDTKYKLDHGRPLDGGLAEISNEIEQSEAPLELVVGTLKAARENIDSDKIPKSLKGTYDRLTNKAVKYVLANRMGMNDSIGIQGGFYLEVMEKARKERRMMGFFANSSDPHVAYSLEIELKREKDNIQKINDFFNNRVPSPLSEKERERYRDYITEQYNYYSNILNTSKLITQPNWNWSKRREHFRKYMPQLSNGELLGAYDDLFVSDNTIKEALNSVDNFNYKYNNSISPEANENLSRWFATQRKQKDRFILKGTERILLGLEVVKELENRKLAHGDVIRAEKEN